MSVGLNPLDLYALGLAGVPLTLRYRDGRRAVPRLDRWLGGIGAPDASVLDRAVGPVLDVGCGPGRHLEACRRRGLPALGVDLSADAVAAARARGGNAVHTSVFGTVPDAGRWGTALLLDGNIGIGGRPDRLLARVRELLCPGGRALVELDAPGGPSGPTMVRLETDEAQSGWFAWAHVAADDIRGVAADAGLRVRSSWDVQGRWFAWLGAAR
jgi:SAM-dependent methyltransferase